MSLWRKLNTLMKASSQAPLESLVVANSIQIFEQEIRDAELAINKSKRELACVMAEKTRLKRSNSSLAESVEVKEQRTLEAIEKGEEDLAAEVADLIAVDEQLLTDQKSQLKHLETQESRLRQQLKEVVSTVARYRNELRLAKANQSAEKAMIQLKGCASGLNSNLDDMAESLSTIKERQQGFRDYDDALSQIEADCSGRSLERRLDAAGINNGKLTGKDVLERLKKQKVA